MLVRRQAEDVFGSPEEIRATATSYFNTISNRIPIIFPGRFPATSEISLTNRSADFTALCLCMRLALQHPAPEARSMQSSLYVTVKGVISLLESVGYLSLELVQCRILVVFYEIGHGIFPGASISIAACARTARALGLHKQWTQPGINEHNIQREEERRVWWAIFNLDR